MNAAWARTLSAPEAPSAWRVFRRSYAAATCSRRTSRPARRPLRLGAGELLPDRRLRATQAPHQRLSHFEPTLAWGVVGVKPAPPLALRRLTVSGRAPYYRSTVRDR